MSSVYFLELNTHALLTLQLSELPETQHKPLWYATMRCIGQESAKSQQLAKPSLLPDGLTTATTSPSLCFGAMSPSIDSLRNTKEGWTTFKELHPLTLDSGAPTSDSSVAELCLGGR